MSAVMEATTPCPVNPRRHSAANYCASRRYRQQNGCSGTSRSRSGNDNHNEAYQVHQFTRRELHLAEQSVAGSGVAGDKAGWEAMQWIPTKISIAASDKKVANVTLIGR